MDFRIEYTLTGVGWAECTVRSADQSCSVTASYLSDALESLVLAGQVVLAGFGRVSFSFNEEPGEFRWVINDYGPGAVDVEILEFDELWGEKPDSEGTLIFKTRCQRTVFAKAIAAAANDVLDKYGEQGYLKKWAEHPFPSGPFAELGKSIKRWDANHAVRTRERN